jgi:hypothetical protein
MDIIEEISGGFGFAASSKKDKEIVRKLYKIVPKHVWATLAAYHIGWDMVEKNLKLGVPNKTTSQNILDYLIQWTESLENDDFDFAPPSALLRKIRDEANT